MSVRIRLKRAGAKRRPTFRIVVADSRNPRDGANIEEIGYFNPIATPPEILIKQERFDEWVKKGAVPTPTVKTLLKEFGKSAKKESAS